MKLQTQISLQKEKYNPISYTSKILSVGSCFAVNIGSKLAYYKFETESNPLGILFHPKAVEKLLTKAINEEVYMEEDVFYINERWHCFDAHSELSHVDKNTLLANLNEAVKHTYNYVCKATHLVLTYGTAWVYRHIESDAVVTNCHKVPQKKFLKEILSVAEVYESIENSITLLKTINPKITTILTVSPVRHIKDGFVENQRSKAHLLAGIHEIVDPRKQIHYFPSYEIVMDELRDYRFYKEDMIHPNQTAIEYVWEKFEEVWIAEESKPVLDEIETIQKGLSHKPFNPSSEAHQQFLKKIHQRIEILQKKFSHIRF